MERRTPIVIAAGVAGMAGFVGAIVASAVGWVELPGYLAVAALSLALYTASVVVGNLGNALRAASAQRPRGPRRDRRSG